MTQQGQNEALVFAKCFLPHFLLLGLIIGLTDHGIKDDCSACFITIIIIACLIDYLILRAVYLVIEFLDISGNFYKKAFIGSGLYLLCIFFILLLLVRDTSIEIYLIVIVAWLVVAELPRIIILAYFDAKKIQYKQLKFFRRYMNIGLIIFYVLLFALNVPGLFGYSIVGIFVPMVILWAILIIEVFTIYHRINPIKQFKKAIVIHAASSVVIVLFLFSKIYLNGLG